MAAEEDPEGFERRLAQYAEWMRFHHYAADTLRCRLHRLRLFILWCAERGLARPAHLTRAILERYQAALYDHRKRNGLPLSLFTQRLAIADIRVFFKWLATENHILHNPAKDLVVPRLPKLLPKNILTADEMEKVLAVPDVSNPIGLRDRAILETLYSTGLRRIELVRLGLYDLDAKGGTIFIREGKARQQRVVPIGPRALAWIDRYLREVRPRYVVAPDPEHLFLTQRGGQIRTKEVTRLAHDCIVAADLGKVGSAHLFRHTCATVMLENGADIRFIQALLGHANLASTQIYARVAIGKLKEVHAATHPASKAAAPSMPKAAAPPMREAAAPPPAASPEPPVSG